MYKLVLAIAAAQALTAIDVSSIVVSPPQIVCELDPAVLKGSVRRLSWSVDGQYLHLQTIDRDVLHDYIVDVRARALSLAFGEPEWAAMYWATKSDLAAPGLSGLRIEVIEDHQRTKPAPFSGGFANGGAQTVDQRNPNDTFAIEVKLKLLGEEVGYFLNEVAFGGITFGWGPAGTGALAFVDGKGRVVLFDREKRKHVVPGTKSATLPAWSPDGTHVAFIERDGRRNSRLMTTSISHGG